MIETLKQFHQQWHSSYVGIDLSELIRLKLGVGKIHQAVIDLVGIDLSELIRLKLETEETEKPELVEG